MEHTSIKKWWAKWKHVVIAGAIFVLSLAAAWGLFGLPDIWKNVFVVIVSVAATYVIVAIVNGMQQEQQSKIQSKQLQLQKEQLTLQEKLQQDQIKQQLLSQEKQIEFQEKSQIAQSEFQSKLLVAQRESDEKREKNIQIYQRKIEVFSDFINRLWTKTGEIDMVDDDFLRPIREDTFNRLLFYLSIDDISELKDIFSDKGLENTPTNILCSKITNVIRRALDNRDYSKESPGEDYPKLLKELWGAMTTAIENSIPKPDNSPSNDDSQGNTYKQAWHFAMWDERQFKKALDKGVNELSLIEYGESWRTNLLKQVGENDMVFLFRRGGYGYVGAFEPLGYRIFEYEGDQLKETIHYYNETETRKNETRKNITKDDEDVENYDIYGGLKDGADICANLIVNPISYNKSGVGNPGGVYRRTISRYDAGYAATLLEWFKKEKNSVQNTSIEN